MRASHGFTFIGFLVAVALSAGCSDDSQVVPPVDRGVVDQPQVDQVAGTEGLKTEGGGQTIDCTGKADGTNCSPTGQTGLICLSAACVSSSCGDKYVDAAAGEDCEDGNSEPSDGCDACKWNCKAAADCDDKNTCNGAETCDATHKCAAGTAAADGTACTLASGNGVCNGGVCATAGCGNGVKDGAEECDDGNKTDGDGCNNDCKFSCHADADCLDSNKCNGAETCKKEATKQSCLAGTALNCDDGKACTKDLCAFNLGCMHIGVDADKDGHVLEPCGDDCNDADPAIFKGAPECADGKDNDCDLAKDEPPLATGKCWPDADGDSYGTVAGMINNCVCPKGYTARDPNVAGQVDCKDTNATVNPAQTGYFTKEYCKGSGNICFPTFDYNCANGEEPEVTKIAALFCQKMMVGGGGFICVGSGWSTAAPACGVEAKYTNCIKDATGTTCLKQEVLRKQACH